MTKDEEAAVNAISHRCPEFYRTDPQTWFGMLDANFAMRSPAITNSLTKFYFALQGLPPSVVIHIKPIIKDPKGDAYERMRIKLTKVFEKLALDQAYELLAITEIGSKRPSEAIAYVEELWDSDAVKLAIILRMLPPEVAAGLDDDQGSTPEALGEKADRIQARQAARKAAIGNGISSVATEINAIKKKEYVKKPDTFEGGLCFVHRKFGKDAYTCRGKPCTMEGQLRAKPAGNDKVGHK
jgi:hypothetical protein